MNKIFYKGISFKPYDRNKSLTLTNVELVKQDLLNHIFTRRGERVMLPRFGTRIPDMLMEPLDAFSAGIIQVDLQKVFDYDPRVDLIDLRVEVDSDKKCITAKAELLYLELNFQDTFDIRLDFER